jgi:hypothetical protein
MPGEAAGALAAEAAVRALAKQSAFGALVAAYVSPLILFWIDLVWRVRSAADGSICGADASAICALAETFGAFLFTFLWALLGLPFAFVITLPCALILGLMAPSLEQRLEQSTLALVQYGLAAAVGVIAGLILDLASFDSISFTWIAGIIGGPCGAWAFRRKRYFGERPSAPR